MQWGEGQVSSLWVLRSGARTTHLVSRTHLGKACQSHVHGKQRRVAIKRVKHPLKIHQQ